MTLLGHGRHLLDNLFLITLLESQNHRSVLIFIAPSYNQPKFCPSVTWSPNAITLMNSSTMSLTPYGIFVTTEDIMYISNDALKMIFVWFEGNSTLIKNISTNSNYLYHLFVTGNGNGYINSGNDYVSRGFAYYSGGIGRWTVDSTNSTLIYSIDDACYGIFVDITNTLYCSLSDNHKVVKRWLGDNSNTSTIVAGTGSPGSTPALLNGPYGIFVDVNFDLYVADCYNDRVQMFQLGQSDGVTVAGSTATGTITLNYPTAIVLDADKYLFIVDYYCRVVGSGPNGFRCIVGCTGSSGPAANQLSSPWSLSFDSYGNIFVADTDNDRVQKFFVASNSCGT